MKKIFLASLILLFSTSAVYADQIKLMIPKGYPVKTQTTSAQTEFIFLSGDKNKGSDKLDFEEIDVDRFIESFNSTKLKVTKIEFWIVGKTESGGLTKYFVSFAGEAGIKVILEP